MSRRVHTPPGPCAHVDVQPARVPSSALLWKRGVPCIQAKLAGDLCVPPAWREGRPSEAGDPARWGPRHPGLRCLADEVISCPPRPLREESRAAEVCVRLAGQSCALEGQTPTVTCGSGPPPLGAGRGADPGAVTEDPEPGCREGTQAPGCREAKGPEPGSPAGAEG